MLLMDLYNPTPFSYFDFLSRPKASDIYDAAGRVLTLDVPGYRAEDIEVETTGSLLTIHGKSKSRGDFTKSYRLRGIDTEAIEVSLDAGVLTVALPQAETSKPKRIEVRTAGRLPEPASAQAE
jgi:HSP20 family protein